jgi:hypothetical protein
MPLTPGFEYKVLGLDQSVLVAESEQTIELDAHSWVIVSTH